MATQTRAAEKMPVIFVGHGSPMNALVDNRYTQGFAGLQTNIPRPTSILSVSAHWFTEGTKVLSSVQPKTIYDFGGFPKELYEVPYQAKGAPELAKRIAEQVPEIIETTDWGIDHGTWSVLVHLPSYNVIPITQLSLNNSLNLGQHYELGQKLKGLRSEGVLIIASGNIVHNLRQIDWNPEAPVHSWALEFDKLVTNAILTKDLERLLRVDQSADAKLLHKAHSGIDHFIPLVYALGAAGNNYDQVRVFNAGIQNASISMTSFVLS